jgi:signal transduction histidine kinase
VSGLVVTPDGDRWLNGGAGVLHVRAADWQAALSDPDARLRYETLGVVDGYPGRALIENRLPSAHTVDGRHLWFIGKEGVVVLDAADAYRNPVRPHPLIEGVLTPRGLVPAAGPVTIGPDVGRFGVQFTAPLLRMPERVRFEYLLEGFDGDWQEASATRVADYTRVPPGAYRFRVRAYNEDGMPGPAEAVLALRVEPALTQTLWFRALATLLIAALVVALVRYRVRHVTARLHERLRVKTAERERIARALHDSFLQSLQAVMMRLDALTTNLSDAGARRELEAIRAHAQDALAEGRGQLAELRAGDAGDLDDALVRGLAPLRETARDVAFTLQVEGGRRPLRDGIADEVSDIAREALRNAVLHAQARAIAVTLGYGRRALTVSIADDGRGIDAEVASAGQRPGHWGLVGMRERAERIGGLLVIDSQPGQGTTVRLAVPAKRAYRDQ